MPLSCPEYSGNESRTKSGEDRSGAHCKAQESGAVLAASASSSRDDEREKIRIQEKMGGCELSCISSRYFASFLEVF